MTQRIKSEQLHGFVCTYCDEPAPPEWGVARRCPEYPRQDHPRYFQMCDFQPVMAKRVAPGVPTRKQAAHRAAKKARES